MNNILIIIDKKVNGIILIHNEKNEKICIVDKLERLKWKNNFIPPTENYE